MRRFQASDLSRLAGHPGSPRDELRPLLLRAGVMDFVASGGRGAATVARFEALALGLIPLVTDDVLADTERALRDVVDVPASITSALSARLSRVDGPEGARCGFELAGRAASFRFAPEAERDAIRRDLADAVATEPPSADPRRCDAILAAARAGASDAIFELLALCLALPPGWSCDLDGRADRELFVLALVAAGIPAAGCVGAILALDAEATRPVATLFRLAGIVRSTPRPVAAWLVRADAFAGARTPARDPAARAARAI